jgi:hypothetical protein
MLCTSLLPLPLLNITLLSLRSYHQQGCLPARIKPCAYSRSVRSITPPVIRANTLLAVLADNLAALRQSIHTLNELLYTTGVGSLPLLAPEASEPPTEEQLADQAKKAIETLFTLHTRMQETASVAASIMAAPEQAPRR